MSHLIQTQTGFWCWPDRSRKARGNKASRAHASFSKVPDPFGPTVSVNPAAAASVPVINERTVRSRSEEVAQTSGLQTKISKSEAAQGSGDSRSPVACPAGKEPTDTPSSAFGNPLEECQLPTEFKQFLTQVGANFGIAPALLLGGTLVNSGVAIGNGVVLQTPLWPSPINASFGFLGIWKRIDGHISVQM